MTIRARAFHAITTLLLNRIFRLAYWTLIKFMVELIQMSLKVLNFFLIIEATVDCEHVWKVFNACTMIVWAEAIAWITPS